MAGRPPMTLGRYLATLFLTRFVMVLAAFTSLVQLLELLDQASTLLERKNGITDLAIYAGLRLPIQVEKLMPLAVLLAAVISLASLARNNEIIAMRSLGITLYRLFAILMSAAVLLAGVQFVLGTRVVPAAERALIDWLAEPADDATSSPDGRSVWLHSGPTVVSVTAVSGDGRRLDGIRIFQRTEAMQIDTWISAGEAIFAGDHWTLTDVQYYEGERPRANGVAIPRDVWSTTLTPVDVIAVVRPAESLPADQLRRIVEGGWSGAHSGAYYRVRLARIYTNPAGCIIMVLLALPAAAGLPRRGTLGRGLGLAIVLGLGYLLADGIIVSVGEAGGLTPGLAAWSVPMIFACIGGTLLLNIED